MHGARGLTQIIFDVQVNDRCTSTYVRHLLRRACQKHRAQVHPKHDIYSTYTQLLYTICNTIKLRTVSFHIPHIQGAEYPRTVRFQPPDYHLGPTHPLLISVLILTHHPQTTHSPRPNIHQRTHEFAFGQAHSVGMGSSSLSILSAVTLTLALISTCSISAWSACPGVQKGKCQVTGMNLSVSRKRCGW